MQKNKTNNNSTSINGQLDRQYAAIPIPADTEELDF